MRRHAPRLHVPLRPTRTSFDVPLTSRKSSSTSSAHRAGHPQLLVHQHRDGPEAGVQVPAGTIEPHESPADAVAANSSKSPASASPQPPPPTPVSSAPTAGTTPRPAAGTCRHVFLVHLDECATIGTHPITGDWRRPRRWSSATVRDRARRRRPRLCGDQGGSVHTFRAKHSDHASAAHVGPRGDQRHLQPLRPQLHLHVPGGARDDDTTATRGSPSHGPPHPITVALLGGRSRRLGFALALPRAQPRTAARSRTPSTSPTRTTAAASAGLLLQDLIDRAESDRPPHDHRRHRRRAGRQHRAAREDGLSRGRPPARGRLQVRPLAGRAVPSAHAVDCMKILAPGMPDAPARGARRRPRGRRHKPWTRWWWPGNAVDKENLTRQLEQIAAAGFGGVEVTPIYGVKRRRGPRDRVPVAEVHGDARPRRRRSEAARHAAGHGDRDGLAVRRADWVAPEDADAKLVARRRRHVSSKPTEDEGEARRTRRRGLVAQPVLADAMTRYLTPFDSAFASEFPARPRSARSSTIHSSTRAIGHAAPARCASSAMHGYDLREHAGCSARATPTPSRVKHDYRQTLDELHLAYMKAWVDWCHRAAGRPATRRTARPATCSTSTPAPTSRRPKRSARRRSPSPASAATPPTSARTRRSRSWRASRHRRRT